MRWLTFLTVLALLVIALSIVGSIVSLGGAIGRVDSLIVVALAAAVVIVVAVLGTRRRRWLSNPYW